MDTHTLKDAINRLDTEEILVRVSEGHIVGPAEVLLLLEKTKDRADLESERGELMRTSAELLGRKPISLEELLRLPLNHASNPAPAMARMETAFVSLAANL